jgi:hypothetical protein
MAENQLIMRWNMPYLIANTTRPTGLSIQSAPARVVLIAQTHVNSGSKPSESPMTMPQDDPTDRKCRPTGSTANC